MMTTAGSLELRLFGAPSIRAPAGLDCGSLPAQPKRFALLAYLAAASPYGFHRRDTLLGLFWPEADQAHGRTALRQAIHMLRCELGRDAVVGRGAAEVGLAGDAWSDVRAFERALAAGRHAEALSLYLGDLLPGLFLADVPDFERWLEETRDRLRRQAAEAAWTLSEQLEQRGQGDQAARWARWAWALGGDDERALRRLLALLGRLGDRAGAMRVYQTFATRLRHEYHVAPAVETQALLATVDRDEGPVAVFPFRVHGHESAAYLREGMADLLSSTLDDAGCRHVSDPSALLSLTAREGDGQLDPTRAAALARRVGARHYILGSVVSAAGRLRIGAALYQGSEPAQVQYVSAAGPADKLFDLVADLADKLLGALHSAPLVQLAFLAAAVGAEASL
jgi:serine/threonine-protein kinase